jgi:hypothetical protein
LDDNSFAVGLLYAPVLRQGPQYEEVALFSWKPLPGADETAVNYGSVMGLLSDTHMDTNQFSSLAVAFYITYLAFELPTGYLMQRLPTAKYLGFNGN